MHALNASCLDCLLLLDAAFMSGAHGMAVHMWSGFDSRKTHARDMSSRRGRWNLVPAVGSRPGVGFSSGGGGFSSGWWTAVESRRGRWYVRALSRTPRKVNLMKMHGGSKKVQA